MRIGPTATICAIQSLSRFTTTRMSVTWGANCRPPNKRSCSSHRLLPACSFEEISQVGFKRLFGRGLSIRREPVFEISDSNRVLDHRLLDGDRNRRILMDPVYPVVCPKNEQAPRRSLEEAARRDFDRVFHAVRVPAG